MKRLNFLSGALLAGATLAIPVISTAAATPAPRAQDDRGIYDRDHKDYHKWDDAEDRAWRRWIKETHRKDHEFAKADRKEQQEYWKWRHEHPDQH
jgi:hypothetical protein